MVIDFLQYAIDYFSVYDWNHFLLWAYWVSGAVSIMLAVAIGVIVKKLMYYNTPLQALFKKGAETISASPRKTREPWQEILKKLDSENSADWALAIIQADAIADRILQEMGLPGSSMGERLKTLDTSRLQSLNDLWEAHLIRNEIAHAPERGVTKHRAVRAVSLYEKVFRELRYIE